MTMWDDLHDAARRAYLGITRGTIVSSDDKKKLQEVTIRDRFGEKKTNVEHWHPFGFTAIPRPPKDNQEAEALVVYLGGSPDHPVVIGTADRRYRPKDGKEGEVILHNDVAGQEIRIGGNGIIMSLPSGKSFTIKAGGVTFKLSEEGIDIKGGFIKHDGKLIDKDHKHTEVQTGPMLTGKPA